MLKNMDEQNKIIYVCASEMTWFSVLKLKVFTFFHKDYKIALNMNFVRSMREEFLNILKFLSDKNKLSMYNLSADLMELLGLRNCDKYVNIYADETDFLQNTRAIVNRKFTIC